jgi:transposase
MPTITRKIEVYIDCTDKEKKKELYERLYFWRSTVVKCCNLVASHKFTLDNLKDYLYITEDLKLKLADSSKDEEGMLNCSSQNIGYKVLSAKFKGDMPAAIFSAVNTIVHKYYTKEKTEYYAGKRSLRNYRKSTPVPLPKTVFYEFKPDPERSNFTFQLLNSEVYSIPFVTRLGRDRSNNRFIIDQMLEGKYPMCDSSIMIDDKRNKIFLLLCVEIPKQPLKPIEGKLLHAELDIEYPITCTVDKKTIYIGNREEYLHRRTQIQAALRNLQKGLRYARGGHGRSRKLEAIDRFHLKEKNYITTKIHTYSSMLVDVAIKNRCEKIILINQEKKEEAAREDEFLLRNWSYYDMIDKITYKASKYGIVVEKSSLN